MQFWQRLTEPTARVQDPEERQKSQFMAALMLMVVPVALVSTILVMTAEHTLLNGSELITSGINIFLVFIAYLLSRTGRYKLAILMGIITVTATILVMSYFLEPPDALRWLYFLTLTVTFSALFLPMRVSLFFTVAHGVGIVIVGKAIAGTAFPQIISGPVAFNLVTDTLMMVIIYYRRRLDIARIASVETSELRYRTLVENIRDIVVLVSTQGTILDINPAVEHVLGWSVQEIIGKHFSDFVPPSDVVRVESHLSPLIDGSPVPTFEQQVVAKSGHTVWLEFTITPRFENGIPIGALTVGRDITESKVAKDALAQERNLLRTLIDIVPDRIYVKDTASRFLIANNGVALTMGAQSSADVLGKNDFDFYSLELAEDFFHDEQTIIQTGQPLINKEELNYLSPGKFAWVLTSKVPLRDPQGNITGIVGITRDITEQKRIQETLTQERNLLRTLIDHIPDSIYVKDTASRFLIANQSVARLMGAGSPANLIGKTDYDFYPHDLAHQFYTDEQEIFRSGIPLINKEEPNFLAPEHERWILTTKVPLRDTHGLIIGLVGLGHNITERKQAEEQKLKFAVERERLTLLNQFIRAVSHDFRTSLATIETSRYLIDRQLAETDRQRIGKKLATIGDAVDRLTHQIENLDSLSSLVDLHRQPQSLKELIETAATTETNNALQKNIRLLVEPPNPLLIVRVDGDEIAQVLHHLVVNALTYTPTGGSITLRAYATDHAIRIEVQDTGIGIAPEHLPHIFDLFYRVDPARPTISGGVGLGLSIVKMIVEAHGGSVTAVSTLGQGTTFTLSFPTTSGETLDV